MSKKQIKSNKIRIGDINLSYYSRKSKKEVADATIIFLHGFPFNKNSWKNQLQHLDENFTGIALDIRGHGNSTSGHGFFSIDVFAKDLVKFIEKLDLSHVVLCGLSMGGYIALRTYELIGQQLAGLILSSTHAAADDNKAKQKRFDAIQAVLKHGRRPFAIGFSENIFAQKTLQQNSEAVSFIKSSIRRNNISSICATELALASRTDTTDALKTIVLPVLYILGKEDKLVSESQKKAILDGIQDIQFEEFEHSGHLPNLEEPEKFNTLMNTYLKSLIPFKNKS